MCFDKHSLYNYSSVCIRKRVLWSYAGELMEKIFSRLSDTCDINQPFKIGKLHDLFFYSLYHLIFIFISFFFKK